MTKFMQIVCLLCCIVATYCVNDFYHKMSVVCPGGKKQCPNGQTCCEEPNGDWGCCPMQNAVCCKSRTYCCPEHTVCYGDGQCIQQNDGIVLNAQKKGIAFDVNLCPDGISYCDEGDTCCPNLEGTYSCCSLPNAVCCSDLQHCCPSDTTCVYNQGKCVQKDKINYIKWTELIFKPNNKNGKSSGKVNKM